MEDFGVGEWECCLDVFCELLVVGYGVVEWVVWGVGGGEVWLVVCEVV